MIDDVRKTVLTALNKENRGYLTPEQFNLYAKQAQMNIFNLYFSEHARLVSMKNARRLSSEYGDMLKSLSEKIEVFVKSDEISHTNQEYLIPSDLYQATMLKYYGKKAEKISHARNLLLGQSNLTAPNTLWPTYTESNCAYKMNPHSDTDNLTLVYIKTPADPVWTYSSISGSEEPIFNPSASDYQDFELPAEDAPMLVLEILKLAGLTIREPQVVSTATSMDNAQYQKENS
jgi:hypothetical protein